MSKIEWTDKTWNPIVGCTIVSPGCANCYAMRQAARIEKMVPGLAHYQKLTQPSKAGAVWTGKVARGPDQTFLEPLNWRKPRLIFVNSMGDLFHESVPDEWIDRVFAVMALATQHTFQILTKRAKRMRDYFDSRSRMDEHDSAAEDIRVVITALIATPSRRDMAPALKAIPRGKFCKRIAWPLPNVWLGGSCEDQRSVDERIPDLLETPAAIHWVSAEPLLAPLDLSEYLYNLDWIVAGGESGARARPMHPDWPRALRDQCAAAGVPFSSNNGANTPPFQRLKDRGTIINFPTEQQCAVSVNAAQAARSTE